MQERPRGFNLSPLSRLEINYLDIQINFLKFRYMEFKEPLDWQALTGLTQGRPFVVERVRLTDSGVAVEGPFALPKLAQLAIEDQVFIAAFVRSHGSIKEMEQVFGVSYPTIKARLNRIGALLDFVDFDPAPERSDVIERLARGEISAGEALQELEQSR
jgi:hypothetical protein